MPLKTAWYAFEQMESLTKTLSPIILLEKEKLKSIECVIMHAKHHGHKKKLLFIFFVNIKLTLSDFLFFAARPEQKHGFRFQ